MRSVLRAVVVGLLLLCLTAAFAAADGAASSAIGGVTGEAPGEAPGEAAGEAAGEAGQGIPKDAQPPQRDKPGPLTPGSLTPGPLTQGSLSAYTLPSVTVYGVADQPPSVPVVTRFGTQFNVVTEEQISRQGALDFYDALRNVPGVMFQKKNIIGGQTGHSLYIRGRGASHPSPDLTILFDDVPRSGVLYGQALADGIPVYALGGMEVYKYPQPSRFGSGYGMINFIPRHMTEEGVEARVCFEGGSHGTFAENLGAGAKKGPWDIYAAQSLISTDGHVAHSDAKQESYYANLGYRLNDNWSVRFMANYVDAGTESPGNPLTGVRATDRYDTETTLVTLSAAHEYDQASGYVKLYYNSTNFYIRGEKNGAEKSKQSNDLWGLRARETFSLWEGSEFVAGFDLDRTELTNENWRASGLRTWEFPNQTVFSPYVAASQLIGNEDGLHVIPSAGLRYYSHSLFKDKASPQAGLVLGYARTGLSFNYARGVNYPSPVVLQNFLTDKSLPKGFDTEKIKPEVVDHYEVALTHSWEGIAALGATYFYDRGKDRTRAYMFGRAPSESFFNSTTARYEIEGVELSASLTPLEGLELFAGATWMDVEAKGDNGEKRGKMPYTPSFALQAGFAWNFYGNFTVSGDYRHLRDVYAATSARTANPGAPASDFGKLDKSDKLPDINVVNIRLDYGFECEPLQVREGKVFVAVDNLLDADYAYALEKNAATGQRAFYYMPGITYMVGFELKF